MGEPSSRNAVALGLVACGGGHVDDDAAAHGGLGSCQAWRDVILKPGADQLGDAIQVLWPLVPQDADRPPVLGQDVLEATEPRVLCRLGRKSARSSSNSTSSTGSRSVMSMIEACTLLSFRMGAAVCGAAGLGSAECLGLLATGGRGPTLLPP